MTAEWFVRIAEGERGPISSEALKQLALEGQVTPESTVKKGASGNWVPAGRVKGLFASTTNQIDPPPMPQVRPPMLHVAKPIVPSFSEERPLSGPAVHIAGGTSYTVSNLMPGESILYAATIHPMIFLPSAVLAFLFLIGVGILASSDSDLHLGLAIACIIIGLTAPLFAAKALVAFLTTECVLTDRRVVGKRGFISRKSLEILLTKVEGLQVDQGILGRIFDYGTVTVSGTGGSKTPFLGVAKPLDFRKRVQQQITVVQN